MLDAATNRLSYVMFRECNAPKIKKKSYEKLIENRNKRMYKINILKVYEY